MTGILYMAITANGQIATSKGDTPWSVEEFAAYKEMVKKIGCEIIGRITYDEFASTNTDPNDHLVVVLGSQNPEKLPANVIFCKSISEAVKTIKAHRFDKFLVAGGSKTNKSALEAGIIDEIYLDVEPLIFGRGILLFAPSAKRLKLKLLGVKKLNSNTVQLHYRVEKQKSK